MAVNASSGNAYAISAAGSEVWLRVTQSVPRRHVQRYDSVLLPYESVMRVTLSGLPGILR
jgi:hypothetical protein